MECQIMLTITGEKWEWNCRQIICDGWNFLPGTISHLDMPHSLCGCYKDHNCQPYPGFAALTRKLSSWIKQALGICLQVIKRQQSLWIAEEVHLLTIWMDLPPKAAAETFNEMTLQNEKDYIVKICSLTCPCKNNELNTRNQTWRFSYKVQMRKPPFILSSLLEGRFPHLEESDL